MKSRSFLGRVIRFVLFWAGAYGAYFRWVRPKLLHWGARGDQPDQSMPGDYLIGDKVKGTKVILIRRGPEEVWPWIAQLGRGAGYYLCDQFVNAARASADYLVPDLPDPKEGDRNKWMGQIEQVEAGSSITWVRRGWNCGVGEADQRVTYQLQPHGEDHTLLFVRNSFDWRGGWMMRLVMVDLEWIAALALIRQMKNLRQAIEGARARDSEARSNRHKASEGHQGDVPKFAS
ncbi:hypothetical protein GF324_05730 [bacterium]|nr:hypothetical protein [bacterium]